MFSPRRFILLGLSVATVGCARSGQNRAVSPVSTTGWQIDKFGAESRLSLKLPPGFEKDYADNGTNYRWAGPDNSQLVLQVYDGNGDQLFVRFPEPSDRPEYRQYDDDIGGMKASVVTYNRIDHVGDTGIMGPFSLYARIETPSGAKVLIYGMATERNMREQIVASVRSIRMSNSLRVRPNKR